MIEGLRVGQYGCAALCFFMATASAQDLTDLDQLLLMMEGEYRAGPNDEPFVDRRIRIHAKGLGEHVVYLQLNQGQDNQIYRQRVLVFSKDAHGRVNQRAYTLSEGREWPDLQADPDALDDLEPIMVDVLLPEGCEQVWTKIDSGYRGYVDPDVCRIISKRTGKPRRIEAETLLYPTGLSLAERGFDDSGTQLFGTPADQFLELHRFRREEK